MKRMLRLIGLTALILMVSVAGIRECWTTGTKLISTEPNGEKLRIVFRTDANPHVSGEQWYAIFNGGT